MSMRGYPNPRGRGRGRGGKAAPVYQEPQVQYAFPHMTVKEILEDMALFDKPLTEADLKSPKPDFVQDVFSFFLKEIFAHGLPSKITPVQECTEVMEFPSLHEDSLPIFHFMRAVYEMLWLAQYSDFNLHDLMAPTSSRFRWQMSALLNLAKFKQSRLPVHDALATGEDDCVVERDRLMAEIQKHDSEIAEIKAKRDADAPQVEEMKKQIPELAAQLEHFQKQKIELTEKTTALKAEFASLTEKLKNIKEHCENLEKDISKKRSKVVSSPDRALAEIASLEEKLHKTRENIKALLKKKAETQPLVNALKAAAESLKAALAVHQECIARSDRKKEGEAQLQKILARQAEVQHAMRNEEENGNILLKSMESIQGRLTRQKQLREDLENQMEQEADMLHKKKMEANRYVEEVRQKEEENKKEENRLTTETVKLCKKFANEMTDMMKKHEALMKHSEEQRSLLFKSMDMFATENKKAVEEAKSIQHP